MEQRNNRRSVPVFLVSSGLLLTSIVANLALAASAKSSNQALVCYLGSWATYSPGRGKFDIEDPSHIYAKLCTHLVYSFAGLDNKTNTIKPLDPFLDLPDDGGRAWYNKAVGLKSMNPRLKVLLAIGGWNEGSENYSKMSASRETRAAFVESAVHLLLKYNFDGLDLDWEYPARRGGKPEDKRNFVELVKDLKKAFKTHEMLLTAAVGATVMHIDESYDVRELGRHLDMINVMAYDYHGPWDKRTGFNAPLHASADDESEQTQLLNVETTVKRYMDLGAPAEKMILGLPLYGRSFVLTGVDEDGEIDSSVGAPTSERGFMGPYTRENGFLSYLEICEKDVDGYWKEKKWDEVQAVPYLINGTHWVSYDNEKSLDRKVKFAQNLGLGGAMVWSVNSDDLKGNCGKGKSPLLTAIHRALQSGSKPKRPMEENEIDDYEAGQQVSSAPKSFSPVHLFSSLVFAVLMSRL